MKTFGKQILVVVAGVLAAGWLMAQLRGSVGLVGQAHAGYDS